MRRSAQRNLALCMSAGLIALDQLIKAWAIGALAGQSITVIPGLFLLTYVENRGAAFGIFQGHTMQLAIVSIVVLLVLLGILFSGKIRHTLLIWSFALIIAGGFGNCIDRVMRGYVVDFLDFSAIFGFPVFNLADCCTVIGTGLVLFYILFLEQKTPAMDSRTTKEDLPIHAEDAACEED